jgi:hypothetical protein
MDALRIACWSGPRNISTAMMRAWENRLDCAVVDEPLYAHYLAHTQADHPGRDEVIAAGPQRWQDAVADLVGPVPGGRAVFYQKHMTHHLLPHVGRGWFGAVRHAFLIRDPREVLLSYLRSRPTAAVTVEDIGVPQQWAIHQAVRAAGEAAPPIIDAGDFLKDPEGQLRAWCALLGIDFTPRMLSWPAGPRASDGVWAPYWYDAVLASTGFEPWRERDRRVPDGYGALIDDCMPTYEALYAARLRT